MSGILIEHQCPQCGAPATLDETDRLFTCLFCRVRLYVLGGGHFMYYITPKGGPPADAFYVPYWRFRGMYFTCPPYEVKGRVLDASFLAARHDFFPETLGARAQTLKLRFISPDLEGGFMAADVQRAEVLGKVERLAGLIEGFEGGAEAFHRAFVGEAVSMIYAPYYVQGGAICDGVLRRPVAKLTLMREDAFKAAGPRPTWGVRFLPALCPGCGWDLKGGRDSLVLLCPNCDRAWAANESGFKKVEFGSESAKEDGAYYIPFWKVEAAFEGVALRTYADLIRAANLPRAVMPEHEAAELYFWLPAFRSNPALFLRLARVLTVSQPGAELEERVPKADIGPVTLGADEAAQGLVAAFAGLTSAKKKLFPMLPEVSALMESARLVLLPFRRSGGDLIHTATGASVPVGALGG